MGRDRHRPPADGWIFTRFADVRVCVCVRACVCVCVSVCVCGVLCYSPTAHDSMRRWPLAPGAPQARRRIGGAAQLDR